MQLRSMSIPADIGVYSADRVGFFMNLRFLSLEQTHLANALAKCSVLIWQTLQSFHHADNQFIGPLLTVEL